MSQRFNASYDVQADGTYFVRAERLGTTDLLSIYINRVRKLASEDAEQVEGTFPLHKGDLVESTGSLFVRIEG